MKPSIQEKIIQYRYSEDGDSSINFKNVRRLYPHHKMVRTTDELVDTLRIRHKVKISKEDIKKILEKKLSSFRSLDFTDGKISRYSRYDKETKTWLKCRKVIYGFWFNFLKLAESDKTKKVDWSKYKGWGGSKVILNTHFEKWFKERKIELFSVKNPKDKPKYIPTVGCQKDSIITSYKVYCKKLEGMKLYQIKDYLDGKPHREKRPRMRGRGETDILSGVNVYVRYAKKILDNVCKGEFPGRLKN